MVTSVWAAISTVILRMRFCLAPTNCSPSRSSRGRDAHAVPGLGQGEPLGLRLHGRQDGDDCEGAVALGLAGQDAAEGLREDLDVGHCGHVRGSPDPDGQHVSLL